MSNRDNIGKHFEDDVRAAFELFPDVDIVRLIDPQNGYAGVKNICDFLVYRYPYHYDIECKSCHGDRFPFANITDNQWKGLSDRRMIKGNNAGIMLWFIDHDEVCWVPISVIIRRDNSGIKSIRWDDEYIQKHLIPIRKKRVYVEPDFTSFFDDYRWSEEEKKKMHEEEGVFYGTNKVRRNRG